MIIIKFQGHAVIMPYISQFYKTSFDPFLVTVGNYLPISCSNYSFPTDTSNFLPFAVFHSHLFYKFLHLSSSFFFLHISNCFTYSVLIFYFRCYLSHYAMHMPQVKLFAYAITWKVSSLRGKTFYSQGRCSLNIVLLFLSNQACLTNGILVSLVLRILIS